jgi:hypothetical protein
LFGPASPTWAHDTLLLRVGDAGLEEWRMANRVSIDVPWAYARILIQIL